MPVIFNNNYDVTVFDPTYANYQYVPDLSIYDGCPKIKAFNTFGRYVDSASSLITQQSLKRDFLIYGFMKASQVFLPKFIYDDSIYHKESIVCESHNYVDQ